MGRYTNYIWDPVALRWINLGGSSTASILYGTVEYWNSQRDLVSSRDTFYIYDDFQTVEDEHGNVHYIPGLKIGDGTSYLIDLPILASSYDEVKRQLDNHVNDMVRHITAEERQFWNNKSRVLPEVTGEVLTITSN